MSFRLQGWGSTSWHRFGQGLLVTLALIRITVALALTTFLFSSRLLDAAGSKALITSTAIILAFSLGGIYLYRRGVEDLRARLFGATFFLFSSVYSQIVIPFSLPHLAPWLIHPLAIVAGLRPDTFLAFYFWVLVDEFPAPTAALNLRGAIRIARGSALALGYWYFTAAALRIVIRLTDRDLGVVVSLISGTFVSLWKVCLPLLGLSFPMFMLKSRQMRSDDRRRARLFLLALVGLLGLPLALVAIDIFVRGLLGAELETMNSLPYLLSNALVCLFPIVTIYTVMSHQVLDVQNIARSAIRHMLAKYSATLLSLVPFGFLVYFAWLYRHATVGELFSGSEAVVLVLVSLVGIATLVYRQSLVDLIDRRFFRDRYDSRRVLTELTEQVRGTLTIQELAKMVERGVDLALHLQRVSLLIETPGLGRFVDPQHQLRPLDMGSPLLTLAAGSREPLAVDMGSPKSPFLSLPEEDKLWLIDGRIEMIAPLCALDGSLIGILALGAKRSDLPFLREDRELLAGVASSAGLVVELLRLKETQSPAGPADAPAAADAPEEQEKAAPADKSALECIACDRLYPPATTECPNCHVDLEKTNVPYIFRDLYRLDSRLGAGGMAVVYRGKDLKLGRPVAIKTLPRVNAEAAMRLRREARTAASVSHPGLAAIYGLETWRGVPMIITEFLPGGTLADQLGRAALSPLDAIDMARTVALALAKIHTVGILHRDVKPSNIGFTEDGDVKLLDFGIARIQHDFRQEKSDTESALAPDGRSHIINTASVMLPRTKTGQLVGTVTYLSPEAARGEKPDPSVDLWALAVCIHESLTAENLFYGRNFDEVLGKIRDLKIPDIRKKVPTCPEPLALFLRQELDLDRSKRAEDGLEFASRLAEVRARILET